MKAIPTVYRHSGFVITAVLLSALYMTPALGQTSNNARFELRPHCTEQEISENFGGPSPNLEQIPELGTGRCPEYDVRDPQSKQTNILASGAVLDMDLIIINPDKKPIDRFRTWIAFDPTTLKGQDVLISPVFPVPNPGENTFSPQDGYIKLSGTANNAVNAEKIVIARITMKVAGGSPFEGSPLSYFEASSSLESKTGIFIKDGAKSLNIMAANPGYLFVRFKAVNTAVSTSSIPTATATQSSSSTSSLSNTSTTPNTLFTLLQVQGLRVTTDGSSVFLAWDALPSSELVGYNIYYGTTTGRYIQRRGVEKSATTLTLRALPVGTTYYFAVRGANDKGQESEFSREVGVSVGNPSTSTSPLSANSLPTKTPQTSGAVSGETGVSSILLALLVISAITGTVLAFRRQFSARI